MPNQLINRLTLEVWWEDQTDGLDADDAMAAIEEQMDKLEGALLSFVGDLAEDTDLKLTVKRKEG